MPADSNAEKVAPTPIPNDSPEPPVVSGQVASRALVPGPVLGPAVPIRYPPPASPTAAEVAARLKISIKTIYAMCRSRRPGRHAAGPSAASASPQKRSSRSKTRAGPESHVLPGEIIKRHCQR